MSSRPSSTGSSKSDYRSRHRARRHAEAHDDDDVGQRVEIPDHPLIPTGKPTLIDDEEAFADWLESLRAAGSFAYDTEFIGESSYYPHLCLVQVATADRIGLIDPLAGFDLAPLWELLADASVRKIVHAGEQDLEPVVRHLGRPPANVFDTQIAAGFSAMAYPTSLSKLVGELTGVALGKGLTFTDWSERPLSGKQVHYAADDVRYLPAVAAALDDRLSDLGHADWAQAACDDLCEMRRHEFDLDVAVRRVKGGGGVDPDQQPVLRRLVEWRDGRAREADLPPRAYVKDEALVAAARKRKLELNDLGDLKFFPRPVAGEHGDEFIVAWQRGRDEGKGLPRRRPPADEPTPSQKFAGTSFHALFAAACHARGLDPDLIASRQEILSRAAAFGRGDIATDAPVFEGWREAACGEMVRDLLTGETIEVKWQTNG